MGVYRTISSTHFNRLQTSLPVIVQDELWVAEQVREAVYTLERAMISPPLQMSREVSTALRTMVRVREKINEWLRQDTLPADAENWRKALERMDCAQSLIVGLNYPGIGARRKPVERAREVLHSILTEGLF